MARLREERQQVKQERENGIHSDEGPEDIDLLCDEQIIHDSEKEDKTTPQHTPEKSQSQPPREQEASPERPERVTEIAKEQQQQTGYVLSSYNI